MSAENQTAAVAAPPPGASRLVALDALRALAVLLVIGRHLRIPYTLSPGSPTRVLAELTARAVAEGVELEGLEVRRPTLEDVYLDLVDEPAAEVES